MTVRCHGCGAPAAGAIVVKLFSIFLPREADPGIPIYVGMAACRAHFDALMAEPDPLGIKKNWDQWATMFKVATQGRHIAAQEKTEVVLMPFDKLDAFAQRQLFGGSRA